MAEHKKTFVSFRVDRQRYALPLEQVEQALRMVALVPVPEAPPWIAGVLNLHGRVIPVMNMRKRFGQPTKTPHPDDRLLVVQALEQTIALMVDEIIDILGIPAHQMEQVPASLSRSRPLTAVIRQDETLILVIDAARLEPSSEETFVMEE